MKKIYLIFTILFNSLLFSQVTGSTCSQANPFCGDTGVIFTNTTGAASLGVTGCLGSTPNPSWFYMPISVSGVINLQIVQTNSTNGSGIDVDYVIYGPYSDLVTPCGTNGIPPASQIVSCSYSAAPIENATIANAQAGQYYLMLTTNFSNQPGTIAINQTNLGTGGVISCTDLRLRLNAFLDLNTNGIQDAGESNFPLGQFQYEKNNNALIHNVSSPTGIYNLFETSTTNSYNLGYTVDSQYAANYSSATTFSNVFTGSTYNFPITIAAPLTDVGITTIPVNSPRPGFIYENKVVYTNLGNQTIPTGTVTFTKDSNVTITSISQTGTVPNTTGFTYNFTNLLPFETRTFSVFMQVPAYPTVFAGQVLSNTSSLTVNGDTILENNTNTSAQIVVNSYDPNDKVESHGGRILKSSFTTNDYLYYTIRFENEGTASALNIKVNDVLDSKLDESSIRMVAASHAYILDRVGTSLSWKFDNIQLPVSVANSNVGKGFITFKIKPKPTYAVGDIIPNFASIYFDYNPAIITNTYNTEFVAALSTSEFENNNFVFYPNPVNDYITISAKNNANFITNALVFDILGKLVVNVKLSGTNVSETVDLSNLKAGIYFVEATTSSNLKVVKKVIVK